ncbi:uncharacterized protein LOC107430901 isoform X2 [Ziziphus jujuba]|uniref:Uncharacterized protein LOC107430901 isoform X2 n=1 Tax=Ziziphus jujuba TaxID=326968 RepID=A0ABM3IPK9_ZIZJJ|nr:uncharacterized protein LOC107430901 isoform X2 [Ziziphus jujuba]
MLNSAGNHYPRATLKMWPDLISKSKGGGIDVIQTYSKQPWSAIILPDCRNSVLNTAQCGQTHWLLYQGFLACLVFTRDPMNYVCNLRQCVAELWCFDGERWGKV